MVIKCRVLLCLMDGDSKERATAGIYVEAVQKHWRHADGHFSTLLQCRQTRNSKFPQAWHEVFFSMIKHGVICIQHLCPAIPVVQPTSSTAETNNDITSYAANVQG